MNYNYVIGLDYGTDSVRAVLMDTAGGKELASSVFYYPRWAAGQYCDAENQRFRQHPLDYVEGLTTTIKDVLEKAGPDAAGYVRGISVDTTGSTPVAVDETGTPLALKPGFEQNPNAMFVLWKDHTSIQEAARINEVAAQQQINYLQYVGGIYSTEWFWAKLLHVLRTDEQIRPYIYSWVEHCDWIPFLLTGGTDIKNLKRGVCSAGHKSLYAAEFGGLPPNSFFTAIDPLLDGFSDRLFDRTYTASEAVGTLSQQWADKLGLSTDVVIGIGAFDCHMGAVGAEIEPYMLSKIIGTSTCDIMVVPQSEMNGIQVSGICGQVPGSVIPGMVGLEAGQSAFGDVYAWFKNLLLWPAKNMGLPEEQLEKMEKDLLVKLSIEASKRPVTENSILAVDWLNGRRTPDANQALTAAISGLHLGTDAPEIFRALVEATCFGARAIVERFVSEGIAVKGLIAMGGVAQKSAFIMQTMADVIGMPIKVHRSEQTCATGAAMFAATAAGIFTKVEDAMAAMGQGFDPPYIPDQGRHTLYNKRYAQYQSLGGWVEAQTAGH
ncbi:L-ribulokinase [Arachidicoccus rhizosphaerae]|jgi:L-ribulokinase|uniref:Ribulokinase n=1 Tax=Arachidicoccus rhizosphaerae TaxID=551991 RepID=A0A1H3ZSM1_9BACT|nr:ribulokinase [Arachidicoccus rhizosphaerae]SEA26720.1 L-ribulokinase [Arachidicoccus rhizosphaerae]